MVTFFFILLSPVVRSSSTRYLLNFVYICGLILNVSAHFHEFRAEKVFGFGIQFENSYGYRRIMVHVCCLEWGFLVQWVLLKWNRRINGCDFA